METVIGTIIASVIVGGIIGGIARMLLPGAQRVGAFFTILAGIVAAYAGQWIAEQLGWHADTFIDWPKVGVQVVLAMIVVGVIGGVGSSRQY